MGGGILAKKLIIIASIILAVGLLVLGALYYIGDRFINEVIDMNLKTESTQAAELDTKDGKSPIVESSQLATSTEEPGTVEANDTGTNLETKNEVKDEKSVAPAAEKATSDKKVKKAQTVYTPKEIEDIKARVEPKDKVEAAAMVLSKFTHAEINELKKIAAGGITNEEKEQLKKLIYERFTDEEIVEIKKMYEKYKQEEN